MNVKNYLILMLLMLPAHTFLASLNIPDKHINYVGTGFLQMDTSLPIRIYKSKKANSNFKEIHFDQEKQEFLPTHLVEKLHVMRPIPEFPQGLLRFTVLKTDRSYYKVVINEITKDVGYIKIEEAKKNRHSYQSWENYLLKAHSIIPDKTNIYNDRQKKINEIDQTSMSNKCRFKVLEVKNEWMRIEPRKGFDEDIICSDKNGWIKWRNNEKILVKIVGAVYM